MAGRFSSAQPMCQVECYGQGKIHEVIVKELNISKCEGRPGVPCILFVYKVSVENADLRNALRWVTDKRAIRKEDICAVFLLKKIPVNSKDTTLEMGAEPEIFNKETKVIRISWRKETSLSYESRDFIKKLEMNLPIAESIQDKSAVPMEDICAVTPLKKIPKKSQDRIEEMETEPERFHTKTKVNRLSCEKESGASSKSRDFIKKLRMNLPIEKSIQVECYGQGKTHEDIVKELNISKCEGRPGVPCILFVYKVSRDNEDLRNALRWVTDKRDIRKEDICAVFLLKKLPANSKDTILEMGAEPEIFNTETKVIRMSWKEETGLIHESREKLGMNLPIVKSIQGKQNKTEASRNEMEYQWTVECYGQGKIHEDIVKELNISKCEGRPGVPCILFVYKVSCDNEDLQNALRWVTDKRTVRKEDICVVVLLKKLPANSKDTTLEVGAEPEIFNKETKVIRMSWKEETGLSYESTEFIKKLGMNLPIVKSNQEKQNKTEESRNEMEYQWTVECYGQGKIHEDIVKELNISKCEGRPGVPCILFVYKVSCDNEDLQNALRWVTDKRAIRKEDISIVFLLKKIPEDSKDTILEMGAEPEIFNKETKVIRMSWKGESGLSHESTEFIKEFRKIFHALKIIQGKQNKTEESRNEMEYQCTGESQDDSCKEKI